MSTSITIKFTEENKNGQKALTNISDTASDADIYNFAKDFMALSTATFRSVTKVVTTEILEPEGN